MLNPPPETKWNVINLGAGVQSSTMALMAAKGEITPMPDFAVFADTQAEPASVYNWLDWLEKQLPFPVYRVTTGNLTRASLTPKSRKVKKSEWIKTESGYVDGEVQSETYMRRLIPLFGIMPDGRKTAAIGRKCTADYKIKAIIKEIKERCDIKRAQKEVTVTQWIGISWDEIQRMKEPSHKWTQHRWPLIEKRIRRDHCIKWMKDNGYQEPPRSACYYCPFHSDDEWRYLRDNDPCAFKNAVEFDNEIRRLYKTYDKTMQMEVYLHNSCVPLGEIDFDVPEDNQLKWDFMSECEGMCGV